ncbi:MAG TPA: HemK/PrmC family methyltransferase [Acidimicrobiales bacterium]|nr:HemK/PrmC family methyltransferase [Acidimicrobiales bacterium]
MTAVDELIAEVAQALAAAGHVEPHDEACCLVAASQDRRRLDELVARRVDGEPLEWLLGTVTFCGRPLEIDRDVYVPRPQTEELARRAAASLAAAGRPARAADLCTGSGAIAAHLRHEVPTAGVVAVDLDPRAVACARRNGVAAVLGDLGAALASASFDVVTVVAPYVPTHALALLPSDVRRFEPPTALDGGSDGLDVVRRSVADAGRLLRGSGCVLLELGADQDEAIAPALAAAGLDVTAVWHDEDGELRGLSARRRSGTRP